MQGFDGHGPQGARAAGSNSLLRGMLAAGRGLRAALGSEEVRRTYVRFTAVLLLVTLVVSGALIFGVWTLTKPTADAGFWASVGWWALRLGGTVISLVAAPVLSLLAVDVLFPLLAERVFFTGMRLFDPGRAAVLEAQPGLPAATAAWVAVRLLFYFLGFTILAFLVGFIPVIGPILGPVVQVWLTARTVGWELLDPYFDKRNMAFQAQRDYVKERSAAITGFGLPCSLLLAIPLVGPLCFGLIQAAAPALLCEVLEPA